MNVKHISRGNFITKRKRAGFSRNISHLLVGRVNHFELMTFDFCSSYQVICGQNKYRFTSVGHIRHLHFFWTGLIQTDLSFNHACTRGSREYRIRLGFAVPKVAGPGFGLDLHQIWVLVLSRVKTEPQSQIWFSFVILLGHGFGTSLTFVILCTLVYVQI